MHWNATAPSGLYLRRQSTTGTDFSRFFLTLAGNIEPKSAGTLHGWRYFSSPPTLSLYLGDNRLWWTTGSMWQAVSGYERHWAGMGLGEHAFKPQHASHSQPYRAKGDYVHMKFFFFFFYWLFCNYVVVKVAKQEKPRWGQKKFNPQSSPSAQRLHLFKQQLAWVAASFFNDLTSAKLNSACKLPQEHNWGANTTLVPKLLP